MNRRDIFILIVDRNPHVREYLQREFLRLGYEVQVARDCKDVQNQADSAQAPHLVVLDPDLPGQNGYSFLEEFKQSHPEIPVIAHLFSVEEPAPPQLRNAAALVEKSGRIDELKFSVERVLAHRYPDLFPHGMVPGDGEQGKTRE